MDQGRDRRTFLKGAAAIAAFAAHDRASSPAVAADVAGPTAYLCVTCGTEYPPSASAPEHCAICEDERQYVGARRPEVDDPATTCRADTRTVIKEEEPGLFSINTEPGGVGIGQREFLDAGRPRGNVLWDCVAFLDDATVSRLKELGGVAAIAISHPHYYTTMVEWSRALGGPPIHVHALDERWVMRPDPCVTFWEGETKDLPGGLKLVCTGGPLRGLPGAPLAGGGRGAGRPAGGRPAAGGDGPAAGQLHVQLSQHDPAQRPGDPPDRLDPRRDRIRQALRGLPRPGQGHRPGRGEGRGRAVGRSLSPGDPRLGPSGSGRLIGRSGRSRFASNRFWPWPSGPRHRGSGSTRPARGVGPGSGAQT